jgi:hypothetical protein
MGNRSSGCKLRPLENADPCLFTNRGFEALFSGFRCQVSAPPLGASTQFDRKRNFGRPSFIKVSGRKEGTSSNYMHVEDLGSIKNCVGLRTDT